MVADIWNDQIAAVWEDDALSDEERIRVIDELAATLPINDPRGLFERGGARVFVEVFHLRRAGDGQHHGRAFE